MFWKRERIEKDLKSRFLGTDFTMGIDRFEAITAMTDKLETFDLKGLNVPLDTELMSPQVRRRLSRRNYAKKKLGLLQDALRPGGRLLELGAEIGVVSALASRMPGVERVVTVEMNPAYRDYIHRLWDENKIENAELHIGMPTSASAQDCTFYQRDPIWDSAPTPAPEDEDDGDAIELPAVPLQVLIDDLQPTVILVPQRHLDPQILDDLDLSTVDHLILEISKNLDKTALRALIDLLGAKGFLPAEHGDTGISMKRFDRVQVDGQVLPGWNMPRRVYKPWQVETPRVLIATCMKNEGPFILEWLAWHRALGVTDFLIFTNDCTDGSDKLLDRLDDMGLVRHLPNPALGMEKGYFQPQALSYLHYSRQMREVDYVISMDVDEFINIHVGDGRLTDLFDAAGEFDVLSMSELNHGSNNKLTYERDWVTRLYPGHETLTPGRRKARRGVKSITRLSPRVTAIRNHRPDISDNFGTVKWLDGSGRSRSELLNDSEENGWDSRGSYDLVTLDHFPLRSLPCYLVKMHRGDVVVAKKRVSQRYWRTRNKSDEKLSDLTRFAPQAQQEYERLMFDSQLAALHDACCAAHEARIDALAGVPAFEERKMWIFDEAWPGEVPEPYKTRLEELRAERAENAASESVEDDLDDDEEA